MAAESTECSIVYDTVFDDTVFSGGFALPWTDIEGGMWEGWKEEIV